MKTAISLYSYNKLYLKGGFTHFDAVDQTKKFGMDGVELCIFPEQVPSGKTMMEYAKDVSDYAKSIGLEVPMFTVGANLYCKDPETELDRLLHHVDIAAACGIPMMRIDVAYSFMGDRSR